MGFARELQSNRIPEYVDHCVDYELMKKVLKLDGPDIAIISSQVLSTQIDKVHAFSLGICKAIRERAGPPESLECCSETTWRQLVSEIERFRSFAWYNCEAVRKIFKKFVERFGPPIIKQRVPISQVRLLALVNRTDIDLWLMVPAKRCVELSVGGRRALQLAWIQELIAGSNRVSAKIAGQRLGEFWTRGYSKEVTLGVRNAFLELSGSAEMHGKQRSESLPPRALAGSEGLVEGKGLEGSRPADPSPVASAAAGVPRNARLPLPLARGGATSVELPALDECQADVRKPPFEAASPPLPAKQALPLAAAQGSPAPTRARSRASDAPGIARPPPEDSPACRAPGATSPPGGSAKWWVEIAEVCPLSGFPVSMLPRPPHKFYVDAKRSMESARMVDSLYLVLQVVSTWDFTVLGRPLASNDISSLDNYIKHCKLGPFRLGRALGLQRGGAASALQELEDLLARARLRLDNLKDIQRRRLSRGDNASYPRAAPPADGRVAEATPKAEPRRIPAARPRQHQWQARPKHAHQQRAHQQLAQSHPEDQSRQRVAWLAPGRGRSPAYGAARSEGGEGRALR